jgi:hypothetical protein
LIRAIRTYLIDQNLVGEKRVIDNFSESVDFLIPLANSIGMRYESNLFI